MAVTLHEIGHCKKVEGDVGIEIEVEGLEEMPVTKTEFWVSKKEDSLRNFGMEYITNGPLKVGERMREAVVGMCNKINKKKVVKDCPRTSIHVHLNMTQCTPTQIATCATAYWLVENLLARYCGEDRESNLFCLRLRDAEGVIDRFINSLNYSPLFGNLNNQVRYAGLNTSALVNHGTLEVRLKGGTTDPEEILEWATEMHNLVTNARNKFASPEALFDYYLAQGSKALLGTLFSGWFAAKLMNTSPYWEGMIDENALIVCELAYCQNWEAWQDKINILYLGKPTKKKPLMYDDVMPMSEYQQQYVNSVSTSPGTLMWTTSND